MGVDWIDTVAVVGIILLSVSTLVLELAVAVAALGGLFCTLSVWRLYGGRPWEAFGWLAWVATAGMVIVGPSDPAVFVVFVTTGIAGGICLLGGRFGVLVDVWSLEKR